jgi:hypothetical protein
VSALGIGSRGDISRTGGLQALLTLFQELEVPEELVAATGIAAVPHDVVLQSVTVKYDALAAKQIGNRLDAFVIVNFRSGAIGHR